jgi:hypothetical protein
MKMSADVVTILVKMERTELLRALRSKVASPTPLGKLPPMNPRKSATRKQIPHRAAPAHGLFRNAEELGQGIEAAGIRGKQLAGTTGSVELGNSFPPL